MNNVVLSIDGKKIISDPDKTILEAASENNIYIPNLCHHPDLVPSGVCRMCIVEIKGRQGRLSPAKPTWKKVW
jgi:NADH dehydrogenase/NADH:ubiquinone oxidoreductase subunit G